MCRTNSGMRTAERRRSGTAAVAGMTGIRQANGGNFGIGGRSTGIVDYWMKSPGACASRRISPKAASYCFRFCCENVQQRLGLRRTQVNALEILNGHGFGAVWFTVPNIKKKSHRLTRICTLLA